MTLYGLLSTDWQLGNGRMTLTVIVPPNTAATITLPGMTAATARESGVPIASAKGVHNPRALRNDLVADVGSGRYVFGVGVGVQ